MTALPVYELHIAIDADLSLSFDDFLCTPQAKHSCAGAPAVRPSATHPSVFQSLPSGTPVRCTRQVNAVSQTVVLRLQTDAVHADPGGAIAPAATSSVSTTNTYAVVVLDAQQVPQMLSAATARRCPPHLSGGGPLAWYLDAVVDGLQQAKEEVTCGVSGSGALFSPSTTEDVNDTRTDGDSSLSALPAPRYRANGGVVHLSLIVVPSATAALGWRNITNGSITGAEAASLFSAATAWCAARQSMLEVDDVGKAHHEGSTNRIGERTGLCVVPVELDLCATAADVQQASQMIAALGGRLLKARPIPMGTVGATSLSDRHAAHTGPPDVVDVRPDTQRKVNPSDFHALYTSMLTEISSFSERKTMAAVAAFPTMCHLLEYVDGAMASAPGTRDGNGSLRTVRAQMPGVVYSTNYGEHRSWNVLNDAILEALMTEYER